MRFLVPVLALIAGSAAAEEFAPNDVSILLAPPATASDPVLALPQSALSDAVAAEAASVIDANNAAEAGPAMPVSTGLLVEGRGDLHISSLRIDPGAPGLTEGFAVFGRNLQVRLVAQPVEGALVRDEAVHLVYTFGAPQPSSCPFHVSPSAADIAAFGQAIDALAEIKAALATETDGLPLGVHPAFAAGEGAALVDLVGDFVAEFLTEDRLSALSIAGLPERGGPEPWIFIALNRTPEGFVAVPSPGVVQPDDAPPVARQMLSFLGGDRVVPAGQTRNRLPVDCLANFILPALGQPQPVAADGVSTSPLFEDLSLEAAEEIGAVIADASAAHFFNTDCVSCHTETRRTLDAGADPVAFAAAAGLDPEALPRNPTSGGFQNWNVRAFGWYPGFPDDVPGAAVATAVRRTATETAEVLHCLNEGDWADLSRPCIETAKAEFLDQGWSDGIRDGFYHQSQGGAIMRLDYFLALEEPGGGGRFAAPDHLAKYGFLRSNAGRPEESFESLPVGMTVDRSGPHPMVGLNCAACHAADVIAGDRRLRIDGAPAALDFDRFVFDLAEAMQATVQPDLATQGPGARFQRFLGRLAMANPALQDPAAQQAAALEALAFATEFRGAMALREPAHPSGPGRVDALTQIVNSLAVTGLDVAQNHATPRAPTSYPPLWLVPELEFVQYNLAVADPLARNVGQALGVFGSIDLKSDLFASSVNLEAMALNEDWLEDLRPPPWPAEDLGEIDVALAEQGRDFFAATCAGCHNAPPFELTPAEDNAAGEQFIKVGAVPAARVGTDPLYTRAFVERWVTIDALNALLPPEDPPRLPVAPGARFLGSTVISVTQRLLAEEAAATGESLEEVAARFGVRRRPPSHPDCGEGATEPCGYVPPFLGAALKAGPLVGIWATGPYLHNGSVRTVYQVMSPPEERETTFWVGDRTLDAERFGFQSTEGEGAYLFDTSVPGNGNGGHVFWPEPLSHETKMAILEYLKDPERFPIVR
ncbi:MAG: di-heme-cytochrome C peroxidase [Pseudomonadota bacterium]